jgi:hypothetical protein
LHAHHDFADLHAEIEKLSLVIQAAGIKAE